MEDSMQIKKAEFLIQSVKGRTLSFDERKNKAIELAAIMIDEAQRILTETEKQQLSQLAGMMNDPNGKTFMTALTDQCFRSHRAGRVANQLIYVIKKYGVPQYLPLSKRLPLQAFAAIGQSFAKAAVPLTVRMIRKETNNVILPGEEHLLKKHLKKRAAEGVRVNLNHLGEAILGEKEALHRLQIYLNDLTKPEVEYISVKISTIFSQINLLAWEETMSILSDRLRQLYRTAMSNYFQRADGTSVPKFVNLDMEEYKDLHLTVALFRHVLDEPEFYHHQAGIVLQSYLPDSCLIQQELTVWARQRLNQGGAPIKIRIVKGANLAMEKVEASLYQWPQAPYMTKEDVDANFKRMINYGCAKEHAQVAHLGIGSHNLFDIAYTLLLRSENNVEKEVNFEMLEGMADHIRRVVQRLSGDMLLYCPAATKDEFQNAVAYLVRRLDENTAPENFLRHAFDLKPNTSIWNHQAELFAKACQHAKIVSYLPRRTQNRSKETFTDMFYQSFQNEPDTDWSLPQNRKWAKKIIENWQTKAHAAVPIVIGGKTIHSQEKVAIGEDPSFPNKELYRYTLANENQIDEALDISEKSKKEWAKTSVQERVRLLGNVANELRMQRGDLIGVMIADTGKTIVEADTEISEAIDFAEFYRFNLAEWNHLQDINWKSKGAVLVATPWNFPCSIPAGGILAALAAGNCVIFKPAPEAVLVGWILVQLFWKAGISRDVLQFLNCEDEPVGSLLVKDPRISAIILTGATSTAKLFLKMRPNLDLMAETGGKNTMIITGMSDRDLAIKDLLQSAFGHAGQKCSACSLAILEAEVYDDPHFLSQLRDAAESLTVGSQWNFKTKVNPLIRKPNAVLLKGLTELEAGEKWLLQPHQDPNNPNLWSPGIKLGVRPSSFTFQQELFGPVLGLVRAESLSHAFEIMNQTPYGLTAGIHSLDEREQEEWIEKIEAGNCYINRTITGAIVERQPFGGCKESSFGKGAKAGGPNYLIQLMHPYQVGLPIENAVPCLEVKELSKEVEKYFVLDANLEDWSATIGSYAFYWNEYFSKKHDPSLLLGQDNIQAYIPHRHMILRGQKDDKPLDILKVIAAALTCHTSLEVSMGDEKLFKVLKEIKLNSQISLYFESDEKFIKKISEKKIKRIRTLQNLSSDLLRAIIEKGCQINSGPVMSNGRIELLQYLREVSISSNYHRYGNLGPRENEERSSLPASSCKDDYRACQGCQCDE